MVKIIEKDPCKIMLSGGGSGGSVSPLLGIVDSLCADGTGKLYEFRWLGTPSGPEKSMVEDEGIIFRSIKSGKFRRYWSIKNVFDIFYIITGFFQSIIELRNWKPDCLLTAGSFVSVPVVWAARVLGVPVLVHQQDIDPGLANRLMAPFANIVTVTFEKSLADYGDKAVWTGNPVRKFFLDVQPRDCAAIFGFAREIPIITIIGGGLGASAINSLVSKSLPALTSICQVAHITGKGKQTPTGTNSDHNYYPFEFLPANKIAMLLSCSDIVVTRAGLNFLSELSCLAKPSVIIPMPGTHQEDNARFFSSRDAAIRLDQNSLTSEAFARTLIKMLSDHALKKKLGSNMRALMRPGANENILKQVHSLIVRHDPVLESK